MAPAYNVAVLTEMIGAEIERRGRGAQTDLAKAVGVEVQTVNKWVHGQTHPDPARWASIEEALGWPEGSIALQVMPSLDAAPLSVLLNDLAEQLEDLGRRVTALERSRRARAARPDS
jgi:transcriptional regulator with XRE-family HTH domain